MCHKLSLLILAIVVLADILPRTNCAMTVEYNITSSECESPFQSVNNGCYYFSDVQLDFDQAVDFCASLSHGHVNEITLAMLDYDMEEDQAILDKVAMTENIYWLGGKTENGDKWLWLDGREVNPQASFWDLGEPNEGGHNCIIAQKNTATLATATRAYVYDHECTDPLMFICQIGEIKCPPDFIKIGNYCYLQSWTIGLPRLHWQEARDYCKFLSVPVGYHSDLAVLGLQDQQDYNLMSDLWGSSTYAIWIGAYRNTNECYYQWIDGRELPLTSINWYKTSPNCNHLVCLNHWSSFSRTLLDDFVDNPLHFICQMVKEITEFTS
ncbi:unnamed protein product [Meganyctiphanes norvegica]|uniref:C-type lectin domain-containing protein n=1 Tax=Meganyctiphanes norvegica TaxID=48144 RepID=A0AAV2RYP2_MEGNR